MKFTLKTRARIFQALKATGHWYIVYAGYWEHPLNKVPNCFVINFDGFVQCKFTLLKNGWLKLVEVRSEHFLPISKIVAIGKSITVSALIEGIRNNPWNNSMGQHIELDKCIDILKRNEG